MLLGLISSICVIIILLIICCYYMFSCYINSTVSLTNKMQNIVNLNNYCFVGTGDWDGAKCICKHPNIITNNDFNGNCDKIVIKHCNTILNSNGDHIDYESIDSLADRWYCDCGDNYIFDYNLGQCVLRTLESYVPTKENIKCDGGYFYSVKYQSCLKEFCSWDVLNPTVRINQKVLHEQFCDCDHLNGFLSIKFSDKISGCTKALLNYKPLEDVHIFILTTDKLKYLYSQSLLGNRLKDYLISNIVNTDDGTQLIAVQQHSHSLLSMLLEGRVKFFTHNFVRLINPVTFEQSFDNLLFLNGVSKLTYPPVESFTPLQVDHIMDGSNGLFKTPDKDEINGKMRYLNNKMYYSPIVILDGKLAVNPAGIQSKLYDFVMCYYYPTKNTVIVEPRKNVNN